MIRQIASSSEYAAQALRAMNQPRPRNPQAFNLFDTHSQGHDAFQQARDDFDACKEASIRTHPSRIQRVNESLHA